MTSKDLKLSFIWNVWNTYEDVLLGSEIIIEENKKLNLFKSIYCLSLGGFESPPADRESKLSDHQHIDFPQVPLALNGPTKYKGIFRVFAGIKKAYEIALSRGDNFALVTNADAWFLDLNKLKDLLIHDSVQNACVSCRMGILTSLRSNTSSMLPMTDDHFIILNIKECEKHNVFDYGNDVQFFHSLLGHIGSMHNLFYQFLISRVPENKLFIYSHLESAIGQYGDKIGWNLLPWQFDTKHMLLHANCAQKNELHFLRAELMRALEFDKMIFVGEYCRRYPKVKAPFKMKYKNGFPLRSRTLKRAIHDYAFFKLRKISSLLNFILTKKPTEKISSEHRKNSGIYPTEFLN